MAKVIQQFSFNKRGHMFDIFVLDSGKLEGAIDASAKKFAIKELKNDTVYFAKKQPIVVDNRLVELDGLKLTEEEIVSIQEAVESVRERRAKKAIFSRGLRKTPKISMNSKEQMAFKGVESWTQKIEKKKCDVGFEEYCVHNFKIGNNRYRMVERNLPNVGIVVNPDYKISEDMPFLGGLARKSGDLIFWYYHFPETGWQQIRELTKNEAICYEIIMAQGCFAELAKAEAEQQKKSEDDLSNIG